MRRRHVVALGLALPLVAAAPAAAAQVEVKALEPPGLEPTWDKTRVGIDPGDTVVWSFAGTVQAHNVWSGASTNWSYESLAAVPAPNGSFVFTTTGTYHFVCRVHDSMHGDVIVGDAPAPPPLPLSEQQLFNDGGAVTVLETGGLDTTPPALTAVRARRTAGGTRLGFRVSELSRVTVRFKRDGKIARTVKVTASGRYRKTIRDPKRPLRAGRYRLELRAEDVAGNRSGVRSARLTTR